MTIDDHIEAVRDAERMAKATGNPQAIVDRTGRLLVVPLDSVQPHDLLLEKVRHVGAV